MKKPKELIPTEAQEAKKLMMWASYHDICKKYLIAIPNGGFRNAREGRSLKLQGVKAGVSDYFLAYPMNDKHGLWIELKRKLKNGKCVGKISDAQIEWLNSMDSLGFSAYVAHGADHAIKLIKDYCEEVKSVPLPQFVSFQL